MVLVTLMISAGSLPNRNGAEEGFIWSSKGQCALFSRFIVLWIIYITVDLTRLQRCFINIFKLNWDCSLDLVVILGRVPTAIRAGSVNARVLVLSGSRYRPCWRRAVARRAALMKRKMEIRKRKERTKRNPRWIRRYVECVFVHYQPMCCEVGS